MIYPTSRPFGETQRGEKVTYWSLRNDSGMTAEILDYGATLRALWVPTDRGLRDVVLGFDNVAGYEKQNAYIGATVGRVANRIGGAGFVLDGREYTVSANEGANCLHGGLSGFDQKIWSGEADGQSVVFTRISPDGEEGFPGTVTVRVRYTLTQTNGLRLDYEAQSDGPTPLSLTNHSYFNLNGGGTVEGHGVKILADYITEHGPDGVPTGKLLPVAGTPFDLRNSKLLSLGLKSAHPQILSGSGYDHNFVLHTEPVGPLRPVAVVEGEDLRLCCSTTQPGLQLYTANHLAAVVGKGGVEYQRRCALCLESQNWPDAVHFDHFPNPILSPSERYRHTTVYTFSQK